MSDIFSEEMKKEIVKLFDKRYKELNISDILDTHRDVYLGIEKTIKSLAGEIEDVNDLAKDNENSRDDIEYSIKSIEDNLDDTIKKSELEDVVGSTMLKLMPNFNQRISKEIKKHLVTIAEFVIKNFKEKE